MNRPSATRLNAYLAMLIVTVVAVAATLVIMRVASAGLMVVREPGQHAQLQQGSPSTPGAAAARSGE